jgi:hypothetical protein
MKKLKTLTHISFDSFLFFVFWFLRMVMLDKSCSATGVLSSKSNIMIICYYNIWCHWRYFLGWFGVLLNVINNYRKARSAWCCELTDVDRRCELLFWKF